MEVSKPPVPRVPSPKIYAPDIARDPKGIVAPSRPVSAPEPLLGEAIDALPKFLPDAIAEPMFKAISKFNRIVFKSAPANPPVPEQPGSWRFAVIGDYGSGRTPLTQVANQIAARKPDLILTTGDNVYPNGVEKDWAAKWDPPQFFGKLRENFPVMPSLGNHDVNVNDKPYFRRFPELNGARFYSFDHKGVHFVALNSNESLAPDSPQFRWLDQDLRAAKSDRRVVYFHHPMFSGYPLDNGPLKGYLAPLLARHGVDLVLTGHEHSYQRSKPINDVGTIEVISGNGGQSLHPFVTPQLEHSAYRDVDFGHVEVEVRPDAMVGRYITRAGEVRDTFVLKDVPPAAVETAAAGAALTSAATATPTGERPAPAPQPAAAQ